MVLCTTLVIFNTGMLILGFWIVVNNQNKTAEGLDRIYKDINNLDSKLEDAYDKLKQLKIN